MQKYKIQIEQKKILFIKVIMIIVILIIGVTSYIKNKIDEKNYNNMYNEFLIKNNINDENITEIESINYLKVYVTGAVNNPGVVELQEGARIEDAINLAGGINEDANIKEVNLAYLLHDGQKLYIPNINEREVEYITSENGDKVIEDTNSNNSKVNINTEGIEQLKLLPGVGESLAQKIISYREENGKFKKIEELMNVSGIGDKKFESIKEFVTIK